MPFRHRAASGTRLAGHRQKGDNPHLIPMKTTIDIHDALLERTKSHAKQTGQPLRAMVEEGLRSVRETAHGVDTFLTRDRDFSLFPELRVRDPFRGFE